MFHLCGPGSRSCDGVSRREFLRVGGLGLAGLSLPELLQGRSLAAPAERSAQSCILLYMWGGPSQLETFDLKPHAPEGVRSMFRPIATNVPGVQVCEHLPMLAQRADRYAIVRSVHHTGTNHATSAYHMMTGHVHFRPGPGSVPTPNDYPHIGSAVARFGRRPRDVPAFVALPRELIEGDGRKVAGQGPGILGQRYAPFMVQGDPTQPDFSIDTLTLSDDVGADRFRRRVRLQEALEKEADSLSNSPAVRELATHHDRACRLLLSPTAQRAFNLSAEPDSVRDRYGWHHFGQGCLLARRLVEAGVPLVTVYWNVGAAGADGNWDVHGKCHDRMKEGLLPPFDRAMTALLDDLHARGLFDETLVVWMGEFGRTPRINRSAGRDHWGFCQSILLAGGGVRGGQVYGSSDKSAAYPAELVVSPDDVAATIFDCLGIELDQEMYDSQGRPLPLCLGQPVRGLF